MLGRVRTCSLSSLEALEMERTPSSKLPKDDSLSIYEKTLLKLQQGSQLDRSSTREESTNASACPSMCAVSSNEASTIVNAADTASTGSFPSSGDSQSMIIPKEEPRGSLSVLDMFSRYKTSKNKKIISGDDSAMEIEESCSSANALPFHDPELQEGCIVDPPSPI